MSIAAAKLNIPNYQDFSVKSINSKELLENLVIKYKNHPSIRPIIDKSLNTSFSLKTISKKDIEKEILKLNEEILNLNLAEESQDSDIIIKIIKKNSNVFSDTLFKGFSKLQICKFPSCLKVANFTPVYKKGNGSDKDSYRPVSILPNFSKNFERCLYKLNYFFLRYTF